MAKKTTQDSIKMEHLQEFLMYAITGEAESESAARRIKRLSKQTVNLTDVVMTIRGLNQRNDKIIDQLMSVTRVQDILLKKLGVTQEMATEAAQEYEAELAEMRAEMLAAQEKAKAEKEGTTESKVDEIKKEIEENEVELPDMEQE